MVSYNDSTLGLDTVATYTCDTGYTLDGGSTTRTCGSDGVWSALHLSLSCLHTELVICSDLNLTNGDITYNDGPPDNRPLGSSAIPTAAILATISLEVLQKGSVLLEGNGMGHLQLVKVSSVTLQRLHFMYKTQWFVLYSLWRMETLRMTLKVGRLQCVIVSEWIILLNMYILYRYLF